MIGCTKRNCPLVNPSECKITVNCPYYTSETVDTLQEIKNQIGEMQTYKLFLGDGEKYISCDEVLRLIDEKIKECSE